jgi:hypothetical protein
VYIAVAATAILLLGASAASGTATTDGQLSMDLMPGAKQVGKSFVATVSVVDATPVEQHDSYDLTITVTVSSGLQIVRATSSGISPHCTRGTRSLACDGRVVGGGEEHSGYSQIVIFKALKAGKQRVTARLTIDGDTNPANDTVTKTLTVKPKARKHA